MQGTRFFEMFFNTSLQSEPPAILDYLVATRYNRLGGIAEGSFKMADPRVSCGRDFFCVPDLAGALRNATNGG